MHLRSSSSCNHRHKFRKQWTIAKSFAWILFLSFALVILADKNDSVQQNPTTTPLQPQLQFNEGQNNDRTSSNSKIDSPRVIENDFVRNDRADSDTIHTTHSSLDNEPIIRPPPPEIAIVGREIHETNGETPSVVTATDVEYVHHASAETNHWDSTHAQNDIAQEDSVRKLPQTPISQTQLNSLISTSSQEMAASAAEASQPALLTSTIDVQSASQDADEILFGVLEEPSEVLYGIETSTTTPFEQSIINDYDINSTLVNKQNVNDSTSMFVLFDDGLETEILPSTDYNSSTILSTLTLKKSYQTLSTDLNENETSLSTDRKSYQTLPLDLNDNVTLFSTDRSFEEVEPTDRATESSYNDEFDHLSSPELQTSIANIDEELTSSTPIYEYTVSSYSSSEYNEPLQISSSKVVPNVTIESSLKFTASSAFNASTASQNNMHFSSQLPSSAISVEEQNLTSSFYVSELISATPVVTVTSGFHFTNSFIDGLNSSISSTLLMKAIYTNISNESDVENKTHEHKEILSHETQPIQHHNNHAFVVTYHEKPQSNISSEKPQESNEKFADGDRPASRPERKNESIETKIIGTSTESIQHTFSPALSSYLHESVVTNSPHSSVVQMISPSVTIDSSSIYTDLISSSIWVYSSSIMPTLGSTNTTVEVTTPVFSMTTNRPGVTKFTTKQTLYDDKQDEVSSTSDKHQPVLPTVQISTDYLTITLRTSWPYFCMNQKEFQKAFAKHLTSAIKSTVDDSQIVFFNINACNQVTMTDNSVSGHDPVGTISLFLYVTDRKGEYSDWLTNRLGQLMLKNKFKGFNENIELQDVVLAVQVHRKAEPVKQQPPQLANPHATDIGIVAAVTISCIAGICLILLGILLLILKRRHGVQQQRRCRPATDAYSLESISIYSSFCKRKMRASKRSYLNHGFDDPNAPSNRLNFAHLAQFSTDENAITEEYKEIPMTMAKLGEMPSGTEIKNRYANVIPFPETRVQLTANPDIPGSDYINANYIRGFQGKPKRYVACQAPLPNTIVDFWQMIWENQCKVIIMLTNWDENGVSKCAQYFSDSTTIDNHRLFGDYQITTKKIDVRESFTITHLQLKNLEKNLMRDVIHYWYTAWPAQGIPSEKVSILEMLLEAQPSIKSNPGPTAVHCSPGTGRTGTVIAIDTCKQEFELTRTVDIPRCVYHLRRDRGGLVQTTEQYIFIYEVLNEFACRVMNQSGRSSVRSSR